MKHLLLAFVIAAVAGCANRVPAISPAAARVQIQPANSNILAQCKMLGPVSASASGLDPYGAEANASRAAREQVASLGGDVLVATNKSVDPNSFTVTLQGTAMRCY